MKQRNYNTNARPTVTVPQKVVLQKNEALINLEKNFEELEEYRVNHFRDLKKHFQELRKVRQMQESLEQMQKQLVSLTKLQREVRLAQLLKQRELRELREKQKQLRNLRQYKQYNEMEQVEQLEQKLAVDELRLQNKLEQFRSFSDHFQQLSEQLQGSITSMENKQKNLSKRVTLSI